MDLVYLAVIGALWLLLFMMAVGCARLGGPKQ
jgi:hypothetical protein